MWPGSIESLLRNKNAGRMQRLVLRGEICSWLENATGRGCSNIIRNRSPPRRVQLQLRRDAVDIYSRTWRNRFVASSRDRVTLWLLNEMRFLQICGRVMNEIRFYVQNKQFSMSWFMAYVFARRRINKLRPVTTSTPQHLCSTPSPHPVFVIRSSVFIIT